ncbi:hypothetical protein ACWIFK_06225 [Streptomyces althioticus]
MTGSGVQPAPLPQLVRRPVLDEAANEDPRAIDCENAVTTEGCQVVHDRRLPDRIRYCGAITGEKERRSISVEQVDDRLIVSEVQGQ